VESESRRLRRYREMKDKKDFFATKDLVSATYISYNGVKFASGYDDTIRSWVFEDPQKCSTLDFSLRNGEALVEVNKYESVRRTLLGMVHDKKANGNGKLSA
jgi:asparagine synthetase A